MARRPNYGAEKRQKELKRQQKREEKAERKQQKRDAAAPEPGSETGSSDGMPAPHSADTAHEWSAPRVHESKREVSMETNQQKIARVANELSAAMRQQVGGRWSKVRAAKRDLGSRHVWRFRAGTGEPDRFLLLSHRSMTEGENPAATLLAQLTEARWLDRMQAGPETAFRLGSGGRLQARARN